MAKRKSPDKFHVGQRVVLVLGEHTGWAPANGEPGVVVGPKRFGAWQCGGMFPHLSTRAPGSQRSYRYAVRCSFGVRNFAEEHLRAYDGDALSTWDEFAKATGINLAEVCLVAKPVRASRSPRKSDEVQHG